jgi:UDP-N-acetylmuramate dehydrogenase
MKSALPGLKGRLIAGAPLSDITWFRVGGPAEVLFTPADETDLAYVLSRLPPEVPIAVIGLGSNLLVRDGGIRGVVIRLGRGFSSVTAEADAQLRCGAAVPDHMAAKAAADAGLSRFAFYRGIPGSIGGALRMNAGAHGSETKDVLLFARAVDRNGHRLTLATADLHYSYRHCSVPDDLIFTEALFQGSLGDRTAIRAEMEEISRYREEHQPVKARTGGSTFKNPPGRSAWRLIDEAGCRGLRIGGAVISTKHCNFLINEDRASAEDIERLGETARSRVKAKSGLTLDWEIIRLGEPLAGHATGEALTAAGTESAIAKPIVAALPPTEVATP